MIASLFRRLNAILFKGLLTLLPIALTISLIAWIVGSLEGVLGETLSVLLPAGFYIPGSGLLLALILIFLTGMLVENYLAGPFLLRIQGYLKRAPVIRTIYTPLKDLTDLFSRTKGPDSGQKVVFVKVSDGIEAMGLVMRDDFADLPRNHGVGPGKIAVFIPLSYGFGGFTLLIETTKVRDAGISAERALQLAITGWVRAAR